MASVSENTVFFAVAIYRAGGRKNQILRSMQPTTLEDILEAHHVTLSRHWDFVLSSEPPLAQPDESPPEIGMLQTSRLWQLDQPAPVAKTENPRAGGGLPAGDI